MLNSTNQINNKHVQNDENHKTLRLVPEKSQERRKKMIIKQESSLVEIEYETLSPFFFLDFLIIQTETKKYFRRTREREREKDHLRDEHDADGGTGHEIDLQVLSPFISPNPTVTREEELDPIVPTHSPNLRLPLREKRAKKRTRARARARARTRTRTRRVRVQQGNDLDGSGQRRRHRTVGIRVAGIREVRSAGRCVRYLHAHHRRIIVS